MAKPDDNSQIDQIKGWFALRIKIRMKKTVEERVQFMVVIYNNQ